MFQRMLSVLSFYPCSVSVACCSCPVCVHYVLVSFSQSLRRVTFKHTMDSMHCVHQQHSTENFPSARETYSCQDPPRSCLMRILLRRYNLVFTFSCSTLLGATALEHLIRHKVRLVSSWFRNSHTDRRFLRHCCPTTIAETTKIPSRIPTADPDLGVLGRKTRTLHHRGTMPKDACRSTKSAYCQT